MLSFIYLIFFFFLTFLSIYLFYTVDLNIHHHHTLSRLRKKENGSSPGQEMWKRSVGKVRSDTGQKKVQLKIKQI